MRLVPVATAVISAVITATSVMASDLETRYFELAMGFYEDCKTETMFELAEDTFKPHAEEALKRHAPLFRQRQSERESEISSLSQVIMDIEYARRERVQSYKSMSLEERKAAFKDFKAEEVKYEEDIASARTDLEAAREVKKVSDEADIQSYKPIKLLAAKCDANIAALKIKALE